MWRIKILSKIPREQDVQEFVLPTCWFSTLHFCSSSAAAEQKCVLLLLNHFRLSDSVRAAVNIWTWHHAVRCQQEHKKYLKQMKWSQTAGLLQHFAFLQLWRFWRFWKWQHVVWTYMAKHYWATASLIETLIDWQICVVLQQETLHLGHKSYTGVSLCIEVLILHLWQDTCGEL